MLLTISSSQYKDLPEDFLRQMHALLPAADADAFLQAATADDSTVSIRCNSRKSAELHFDDMQEVPWCPNGYYLPERPSFTLDPLFHAGAYYVQEASSMFLWTALQQALRQMNAQNKPLTVLDLCAAPGGKSTLLIDALPEGSILVSNEIVHTRANILAENLTKWGSPNVIVTEAKPEDISGTYDLVLCDVPCSGEGMFRKDAQAVAHWNLENVQMCAQRQRDIIQAVWPRLREGACLIYSTCTFNVEENEKNVAWIAEHLGAEVLAVDTKEILGKSFEELGIVSSMMPSCPAARFMFHRSRGEGLFMAVLQKTSTAVGSMRVSKSTVKATKMPAFAASALHSSKEYTCLEIAGRHHALSQALLPYYENFAKQRLRMHMAGVALGITKGKDFIPDAALALSQALNKDSVPCVDVSKEQALAYLRREVLQLDETAPQGYVLLRYRGLALGWVKNLGRRSNNLYPNEWRIRTL